MSENCLLTSREKEELISQFFNAGLIEVRRVTDEPFVYSSGKQGHFYANLRHLIGNLPLSLSIAEHFTNLIAYLSKEPPGFIAGVPVGSIALAVHVGAVASEKFNTNVIVGYVQKTKEHGIKENIIGLPSSATMRSGYVIEDIVNTGESSLEAAKTLNSQGFKVESVLSVISYHNKPKLGDNPSFPHHSLLTVPDVVGYALKKEIIRESDAEHILKEINAYSL